MHHIFFFGPMSAIGAGAVVGVWHFRRAHRNWDFRKSDYAWVFLQGGVAYVMSVFLIDHFYFGASYIDILSKGMGNTQVTVAFFGALFESVKSLWDLWWGDGHMPPRA